jgi:PAS domain S-box-containing protein
MSAIDLLLIEDNPGDAELIREMLAEDSTSNGHAAHFRLAHVEQLSAGLAYLKDHQPGLTLLDLSLPDSQGFETIEQLRAGAPDVPIVVLTGLADETFALQAMQAGAQDYLVKGEIDSRLLRRTIRYALERHRLIVDLKCQTQALRDSEARLHAIAERLRVLHEADQAILAASSAEEIARVALSKVHQVIPCRQASVTLFDHEAKELRVLAAQPDGQGEWGQGRRFPLCEDSLVEALRQGHLHVTDDISACSPASPLACALQALGVRSLTHLPLRVRGELIGTLNLGFEEVGRLTPEQVEVARQMADRVAIGLQQARLYEQVRQHADELEDLVTRRTEALRRSEERFRAIFEGAAIGIATTDLHGQVLTSNPALQAMLGYNPEELRRLALSDFTHPDDRAPDLALFHELPAGHRKSNSLETRFIRKDDQVIWSRLAVSLMHGAQGEPRFAIAMVEDITAQKQTQAALISSEKLAVAGKLGASLAHEINNPLQSVIGCLSLAQEALAGGEDVSRYLDVAGEELWRIVSIVRQLRDVYRQPAAAELKAVDANNLVERVLELNRPRCRERGVELEWQPAPALPPVFAAPGQLQQVFLNLVLNALEAMPQGGRLRVSAQATQQPAGVQVRFEDSGAGIPASVLPHIFEPFYTTRPEGMGLGLFICHNIIAEHGGRIEVDTRPGEGAAFTVWLPV